MFKEILKIIPIVLIICFAVHQNITFADSKESPAIYMSPRAINPFKEYTPNFRDSISIMEKEVEIHPDNPRLRFVLGLLYFKSIKEENGKYNLVLLTKAEEQFYKLIKLNKYQSLSNYYLGLVSFQKSSNDKNAMYKAMSYLEEAIKSDENYFRAYMKLSFLYLALQRYEDAITLLEKAKNIFEDNYEIYYKLSLSYNHKKKYAKAIENAKKALSINNGLEAQLLLASAYSLSGDYKNAINQLEKALTEYPKNKTVLLGLSAVLYKKGENEKAIETLKKVAVYHPDDQEIKEKLEALTKKDSKE